MVLDARLAINKELLLNNDIAKYLKNKLVKEFRGKLKELKILPHVLYF